MADTSKYPAVTMRLDAEDYERVVLFAQKYGFANKKGPTPGTLLKRLFKAAQPLFEMCDYDDRRVAESIAATMPRKRGNLGR